MADSLAAIKKLVFEEGKITNDELMDAIEINFSTKEGQRIRAMLQNDAPKYGNDIDYVDLLIVDAYESYLDEMKKYHNTRYGRGPIGGIRYGGTSSMLPMHEITGGVLLNQKVPPRCFPQKKIQRSLK